MAVKGNSIIPIKFDDITKKISLLSEFMGFMEEDLFDIEDIRERYKNNPDAKVELYKLARETYNKNLDFLVKVAELRKDIDPQEASIIAFILNMSSEQKQELKKILLDMSVKK